MLLQERGLLTAEAFQCLQILLLVWQRQTECRSKVHHSSSRACSFVSKMPMGELILHKFHYCPKQIRISMELQRNPYGNNLKVTPQIYMLRAATVAKEKRFWQNDLKPAARLLANAEEEESLSLFLSLSLGTLRTAAAEQEQE